MTDENIQPSPFVDQAAGQADNQEIVEPQQPTLAEINRDFPPEDLCGPASLAEIKRGLRGISWVSIFRNSPFNKGEWEMFLGGYVTQCTNTGAWEPVDLAGDWQYAIQVGMFRQVDTAGGQKLIPTKKCLEFIKQRLTHFVE